MESSPARAPRRRSRRRSPWGKPWPARSCSPCLRAKDCTPEINTSEIIVDFQWHFPNGLSVACANGISLLSGMFQRIVTFQVDFHWKCPMDVQWHFPMEFHLFVISGVKYLAPNATAAHVCAPAARLQHRDER